MAAIFQLRRGTTAEKPTLTAGELYVDQTSENLIVGVNGSKEITLLKLNDINTGSLHLTGDIRLSGSIYLGNETADNISALGVFTTNLVPSPNNGIDIGTTTAVWRNVFATNISGAIAATNGVISGSSQLTSVFEEKASSTHTLVSGSSQIISILDSLNAFSTSVNTETASLESRAAALATYTASVEGRFTTLGTLTGSNSIRLSNLESKSSSVDTQLTTIGSVTSSLETRMTTLANVTSSIHSYTSSLKTALSLSGTDVTVLGNLTVNGTTTQINSTQVNIGDNILELNYGGSATTAGIITKDATGGSTISGSLLWDSTNDYWKAGKLGNESKILLAGGDTVISSSMQLTQLNSFTASVTSSLESIYQTTSSLNTFSASTLSSLTSIYQTTASLNEWTASAKVELANLESKSASVDTSISNINTNTASVNISISNLNNETASIETRFTTLSSYTASVNQTTASLNEYTASANAWSGTIDTRFNTLQQVTSSLQSATASLFVSSSLMTASIYNHEGRITYIEVQAGISTPYNFDAQFLAIAQTTGSLNSFTSSANVRLNNLELTSASLNAWSSSLTTTFATDAEVAAGYESQGRGIVSGSSQITPLLPVGTVSGSSQVIGILSSLNTFTSSLDATYATEAEVAAGYEAKGRGIFSGSSQVVYSNISSIPVGIVSGAAQVTPLLPSGVVSGSAQLSSVFEPIASSTRTLFSSSAQLSSVFEPIASSTRTLFSGSGQIGNYVATITGTSNQVTVAGSGLNNAAVTLSLPQSIATTSNVQFGSIGVGTTASGTSGEIRATGDITAYYSSDIRLKENIIPIPNALEKVNQISGNTYDWKEGYDEVHSHKGNDVGVIAQEVEAILPQIVTNRDTGFKAVQYEKIIPLLIEAIKELSAKVDRLENK